MVIEKSYSKKRVYGSLLIKQVPEKYVSIDEVLDELLCFGWIDGIRRKLDLDRTMQPHLRHAKSNIKQTYKDRFAKLEKLGLVHQAGTAFVIKTKRIMAFYGRCRRTNKT
jgi:hypothetical protein